MADLAYPAALAPAHSAIQGRGITRFVGTALSESPGSTIDIRHIRASRGVIADRVMLRTGPGAEVPFAMGRVWLLRLDDGYKAWEGWSDAGGYYAATGLELGVDYIAVGIDPQRNHKATGAGPVRATLPGAT